MRLPSGEKEAMTSTVARFAAPAQQMDAKKISFPRQEICILKKKKAYGGRPSCRQPP